MKIHVRKGFSTFLRWIIFCKVKQITENTEEIEEMDMISQLPECIVHRILSSFNSPVDLVRMSVLSKNWSDLTSSFPNLDFNLRDFRSRESFFKYIEYTTSRFCQQNVTACTFKLVTTLEELAELDIDIIDRCLELVCKNGVRELEIILFDVAFATNRPLPMYRLPNILLSVSLLKSLTISDCELPYSLMVDDLKFKSLIHLTLVNVLLDDEEIKYLTISCPLLQDFHVRSCHGFKTFCVYRHLNLQNLFIIWNTHVERIDIEAPNLFILLVACKNKRGTPQLNMESCKKLKRVADMGHLFPTPNDISNFLSNFLFIKTFILSTKCKNLKLSSHSLKRLVLCSNCDLDNIELKTPNLKTFIYTSDFDILRRATNLKACMLCYLDPFNDALWFRKLRLFLDKNNGFKVLNLHIYAIYRQRFTGLEKLKAIELPPYELEHVYLQLDTHIESSAHVAFVDLVLWCCRPRSLTLRSSFPLTDFEDVAKFTKEKLLQQEDNGHASIRIVSHSSSKGQKRFLKEEVVQEEAG